MLDGTHYFECGCGHDEHTIRFTINKEDKDLYLSVFLADWHPWWIRLWLGVRYTFGYKSRYGYFSCWTLNPDDAERLRDMCDEFIKDSQ